MAALGRFSPLRAHVAAGRSVAASQGRSGSRAVRWHSSTTSASSGVAGALPRRLPFALVDVFAPTLHSGNPAGVVILDSLDHVPAAHMQAVAAEINAPATAFVAPISENSAVDSWHPQLLAPDVILLHPSHGAFHRWKVIPLKGSRGVG